MVERRFMNNVIEVNQNIVYVKGAFRGAIYNFSNGNVYSINNDACKIIEEFIDNQRIDKPYLVELEKMGLINADFSPKEYRFSKIEKELNFVWLELTEACNLRCLHCYDGDEHKDNFSEKLSFEQWKDVLFQLKKLNCKRIEFIGGEPTVYPYFFDLLKYAVSLGLKTDIYSNLLLFSDELVGFIKEHEITVHFSIYGSNGEVHDSVTCRKGSFEKTIYWVKKLVSNDIKVIPAITIMRKNQDDYENTIQFVKSLGVETKLIAVDTVRATNKRCVLNLTPTGKAKLISLRQKPNFSTTREFFEKAYSTNTCLFGKFSIQPNGNLSPCEFSRDIIYGNVKKNSINEILESDVLNSFWFLNFSKISDCKNCEYRFACKDCRMITIHENLYLKNTRCLYNPKTGTWNTDLF